MAESVGAVALDIVAGKNTVNSVVKGAMNDVQDTVNKSSSGISNTLGKIGNVAGAVGKTVAVGLGVASTAVVALGKEAIASYANYEQLVGGVETLFKENADTVIANASNAYKTAGMSANEYMETVTSFSASLLQSLGNDTVKASEMADMAVTDMADNANKMGTSIEMIQNAYQGFAKQNYTMLDNLKLGYGGTKSEMERLLANAQAISGIQYDISSYADVVDAIHVIQKEMDISGYSTEQLQEKLKNMSLTEAELTKVANDMGISYEDAMKKMTDGTLTTKDAQVLLGTTAKEASSTISGSLSSMKGAWQNLLTGMGDDTQDFGALVDQFVSSVDTVGANLLPRIEIVLGGVVKLVQGLAPKIIEKIPELVSQLLPSIITASVSLIQAIVAIIPDLVNAIVAQIPAFIQGFVQIVNALIQALPTVVQSLVQALPTLIPALVTGLVQMIVALCQVIPQIIQPIIDNLPMIITTIVTALVQNLPILIQGLIQLVGALIMAIPQILSSLWSVITDYCSQGISALFGKIKEWIMLLFPQSGETIIKILGTIGDAFDVWFEYIKGIFSVIFDVISIPFKLAWNNIKFVWDTAVDYFKMIWENIKAVFSIVDSVLAGDFKGAWDGIKQIWSNVKQFFSSVVDNIKNAFSGVLDILSSPFKKAKDAISNVVDSIKNLFKNLQLKFPSIKLPHFTVKPSGWQIGDLLKGKIPSLGISWYAKAMNNPMIMNKPTIFGYDAGTGNLLGGGEAGSELVVGTNTLLSMIKSAVASVLGGTNMSIEVPALQNVRAGSAGSDSGLSDKMDRLIELFKQFIESGDSDMTVPIYIGNELIDEYILNKNSRQTIRSGGYA